nr:hypothetical protein [Spirochaeta sp.]
PPRPGTVPPMDTLAIDNSAVLLAFGLTLFAGLSTGIGSLFAFFARETDHRFLPGLAEPVGAVIGYLILLPFMNVKRIIELPFRGVLHPAQRGTPDRAACLEQLIKERDRL